MMAKFFWNGFSYEKVGGIKLKINGTIYNITQGIQNVFTQTSNIPLKKLDNQEREKYNKILETLDFANYKPTRGESKSGRYKQSKSNFKKRNLQGEGVNFLLHQI